MKMKAREQLDAYYEQAESWGKDQQETARKSQRVAWIIASVAAVVAVAEAFALMALAPLKTVEPYTLMVDKQTGYVQTLKPLEASEIAGNTALTQSFLVQYVIDRENFDINAIQGNYNKVWNWSEGTARNEYAAISQPSNPESMLARLPRSTVIETRVKSVSPMAGNSAMVRFETIRRDAGGQAQPGQQWVAVIRYRYSNEAMTTEQRFTNPLGFHVSHYQRSAETLPPPQTDDGGDGTRAAAPEDGTPATVQPSGASPLNQQIQRRPAAPATPQPKLVNGVELTL
jgi:type IV secretion system protein VirB8